MPIITYYFEFAGGRPRATLNPIRVHRILSNNDMPAMSVSCGSNICAPPCSSTKTVPEPTILSGAIEKHSCSRKLKPLLNERGHKAKPVVEGSKFKVIVRVDRSVAYCWIVVGSGRFVQSQSIVMSLYGSLWQDVAIIAVAINGKIFTKDLRILYGNFCFIFISESFFLGSSVL